MYLVRTRSLLLVTFVAAVVAAGCGDGALSSPTAPSGLPESAALAIDAADALASTNDEFVALGSGKGHGRGGNSGPGGDKDKDKGGRGKHADDEDGEDDDDGEDNHGRRRGVSGFVTAVGADSITVRGIVVKITPTTIIRHGHRQLTLAQIAVGDHAQAKGTMSADGTTLTANEVKVQDTGKDNDDDEGDDDDDRAKVELRGAIAGLPAGTLPCPALTFTIGTTTIKTNHATDFEDVTCATLANGKIVEVEGRRQADGSILATDIELESGPNEVEGIISGLTSTAGCPVLTFTVGTTTVTTSSSTDFDVACASLTNGKKVEVEGTLTGTTLAASRVELD